MEAITLGLAAQLDKIPKPALVTFGVIGLLFALKKVLSFLNLFFSLFVLPGKNVSSLCTSL
jgi:17beta-estradiol 17-dehydrogenase / very-long-chain 3-oxoacyl-CoA reductase